MDSKSDDGFTNQSLLANRGTASGVRISIRWVHPSGSSDRRRSMRVFPEDFHLVAEIES